MKMFEHVEEFEGFRIETSRIRDDRFIKNDFNEGFGWTFQVFAADSMTLTFSVVIKSLQGKRSDVNVQQSREIGLSFVCQRIREHKYDDMGNYCYRWEPNLMPVKEVDCQVIDGHRFDAVSG